MIAQPKKLPVTLTEEQQREIDRRFNHRLLCCKFVS